MRLATDDGEAVPVAHLQLESVPTSVAAARQVARAFCLDQRLSVLSDTATLLVSEVVTNALVHGQGLVSLRITRAGQDTLRVEVSDEGGDLPALSNSTRDAEGGRGMMLVDVLASRWGVEPARVGKTVWFEVC